MYYWKVYMYVTFNMESVIDFFFFFSDAFGALLSTQGFIGLNQRLTIVWFRHACCQNMQKGNVSVS